MSETKTRTDRLASATSKPLERHSLVGSYFYSFENDDPAGEVAWQGYVVAEPHPGVYLVELFEWLAGTSSNQQLVRLEQMLSWRFYDDAEWAQNDYHNWLERRSTNKSN